MSRCPEEVDFYVRQVNFYAHLLDGQRALTNAEISFLKQKIKNNYCRASTGSDQPKIRVWLNFTQ